MKLIERSILAAVFCGALFAAVSTFAQGTAFTYQGQLIQSGAAASGNFDFRFGLYTNTITTNLTGSLETNLDVGVSNGLFTTTLNFSNVFNGTAYWLEIGVRTNGTTNAFVILSPRQPITPAPYAITASNLTGTISASQLTGPIPATDLSGAYTNSLSLTNTNNVFAGNGGGLTNLPIPTQTNYLYLYDNTVQVIASANVFQYVSFAVVGNNGGWTFPASTVFQASQSGLYQVHYELLMQDVSATSAFAMCRAILNASTAPSEILSSETIVSMPTSQSAAAVTLSRTFLMQLSAGQTLSLQVAANLAGGNTFLAAGTLFSQTFPSAALTIVRIQ